MTFLGLQESNPCAHAIRNITIIKVSRNSSECKKNQVKVFEENPKCQVKLEETFQVNEKTVLFQLEKKPSDNSRGKSFIQVVFVINSQAMNSQLILALLLVLAAGHSKCGEADQIQCVSSICPNYYYSNATCYLNSSSPCTTEGTVYYNGACVNCSGLSSSNCSSVCSDFYYKASSSSSPSTCTSCQTLYGTSCIRCSSSVCLICAYTSNLALATDGSGCVNNNCTATNCLICYANDTAKCYKCKPGYIVNPSTNFTCVSTSCSVSNCITCVGTLCGNCFPGYELYLSDNACHPICSDPNCINCIAPEVCGSCTTAYTPNSVGICTIDCSLIAVSNCVSCSSYTTCTACASGYSIANEGSLCVATCGVSNCYSCVSGDTTTCQYCSSGYQKSTDGKNCTESSCVIDYCATCATITTCSACISGFVLSADATTCSTNCTSSFSNCLFCSSTACTTCMAGYKLSSGSCSLVCGSISNCIRCYSETQCSSCANGYALSSNYKTCSIACKVKGCSVCSSSTSNNCTTCESGYTLDTTGSVAICKKNCREGMVNTNTAGGVTCSKCKDAISHCNKCDIVSSTTVCTECQQGYFVNGNDCDKCSDVISNCRICSNSYQCSKCIRPYKLIDGACSNTGCSGTVSNCYSCKASSTSVCYRCNPGYTLNSSNICVSKSCSSGFIFDEKTFTCVCPTGSYQLNGACYPCSDIHCDNCTLSVCVSCQVGYYPVGTTCQSCTANCEQCTSGSNCVQCRRRYSLDANGACVPLGKGRSCARSALGLFFRCEYGCRFCVIGFTSALKTVCLVPRDGYSIVGGQIVRCNPACKACASYEPSFCTSCFSQKVLISGECVACTDTNALSCSEYNPSYSLTCKHGYTAAYSANGTAGVCSACSEFCQKCDTAGPGNCDKGQCKRGSVQLLGTQNCSKCFSGCVRCSNSDPGDCLECGSRRYLSNGQCTKCPTGCTSCTSGTSCQSCDLGYWLVSSTCVVLPDYCTSLDSKGLCTACFQSYKVTSSGSGCEIDLSCNTTTTCQSCPDNYYLYNSGCYTCNVGANCIACQTTNTSQCLQCSDGYYLDASYACQACTTNCNTCDSAQFCTSASSGYYITLLDSGDYSGEVAQCESPCATCTDYTDFCLTCNTGYSLYGSTCRRDLYLTIVLVLGQARSGTSIFSDTASAYMQVFFMIRAFNWLGASIALLLPSRFNDGRHWRKRMRFSKFKTGSVSTELNLEAGSYSDGSAASSDLTTALATGDIAGTRYISSSVTAEGFSSAGSATSLGLVLGLSIPLSILLILIIVLVVYSYRKQTEYKTSGEQNGKGFYSEDIIEKGQDL